MSIPRQELVVYRNGIRIGRVSTTWKGGGGAAATAIAISTTGQRMMVYQNGRLVGEAPVEVKGSYRGFRGESVFFMAGDQQWQRASGGGSADTLHEELVVPAGFAQQLRKVLNPGTAMVITSERLTSRPAQSQAVMAAE